MPFPTTVMVQPAPANAGDFASANPRASVLAGPGALVAGAAGVTIGRFAWYDLANETLVNNSGSGPVTGFVHREQQALITTYLAEAGMVIPPGFPVTLMSAGDYWVANSGAAEATVGMIAYANYANGAVTFGVAGAATTATVATSSVAPVTSIAGTGYIVGTVLTVMTSTGTPIYPGAILAGTGMTGSSQVIAQLSGTTNGIGTYSVNMPEQTWASAATPLGFTGSYGLMTLGAAPSATLTPGDTLSETGMTAGTVLWGLVSGTGGSGSTYVVSPSQTVASGTETAALNVQTKYVAMSYGAPGELVKISSWLLG